MNANFHQVALRVLYSLNIKHCKGIVFGEVHCIQCIFT